VKKLIDSDIDKFFAELEAEAEKNVNQAEVSRLAQQVLNRHNAHTPTLEEKVLADFHGNAPIIEEKYDGELPGLTAKAKIYILTNLEPGQMFRLGVSGGGCSGFNYIFDVCEEWEDGDIKFCDDPPSVVDSESIKFLYGSTIDLVENGMNKQLSVENPGARASCGCGTSFAFDEDLLDMYS
jgi:iron-sulfur cluster assembly accessory protein